MELVRVVARHFVAGFETDGVVRRAAPILRHMMGWSNNEARLYMRSKGWDARIVKKRGDE